MEFNKSTAREEWVQPVLDGMSDRDVLEGYTPDQLLEYKSFLLDRYTDTEKQIHLVNDVLVGYGVKLEEEAVDGCDYC